MSNENKPIVGWVRVSEDNLPRKRTSSIIRDTPIVFRNMKDCKLIWVFLSITPNVKTLLGDLTGWEYLDETPIDPNAEMQKEIDRLRELLSNILMLCEDNGKPVDGYRLREFIIAARLHLTTALTGTKQQG